METTVAIWKWIGTYSTVARDSDSSQETLFEAIQVGFGVHFADLTV